VATSRAEFPNGGASAVVLARGDDYPDALVGAPLAAAKNAPLLLTSGTSLPSVTKTELQRVLATGGTVYVLGGISAIPASVVSELTSLGYHVVRLSGADRFATAVAVANELGNPSTVLLASGINYPDALAAGPAASHAGGVVLLTNGKTMPTSTATYLSAHPGHAFAIGGPAAAADPAASATVGVDRYATAAAVAAKFFNAPTIVGFATGSNFPDALAGGSLLAKEGAPLLLASATGVSTPTATYLTSVRSSVVTTQLFGGDTVISAAASTAITTALS